MKKLLTATAACALFAGAAQAEDIKLGIIFGFTGPIESLTGSMAAASEAAIAEVNASGLLLDGSTVTAIRADSTCVDSAAATAAAERLVTSDQVAAIIGGDCSGVTGAILQNVARPNGIVMISPSATSPALSTAEDDGLFFRTAPSDAREGEIAADIMTERGIKTAALTYTNNDYGKGLAEAIATAFEAKGGKITISAAHEDGKADYTAEVGALAARKTGEDAKWFTVMGNAPLRAVFQTAFNLPKSFASVDIDQQLGVFKERARQFFGADTVTQFSDPAKMDALVRRYLTLADQGGASASGATSALTLLQSARGASGLLSLLR